MLALIIFFIHLFHYFTLHWTSAAVKAAILYAHEHNKAAILYTHENNKIYMQINHFTDMGK